MNTSLIELFSPKWVVGDVANGTSEWQCPKTCRQDVDYSGQDPNIQFPKGAHVKAGRADISTFHQGEPFQPNKVHIQAGRRHDGSLGNLLRMEGGDLKEQCQAMVVQHLNKPTYWQPNYHIRLAAWFLPTSEGYPDLKTAQEHLFTNIELRGDHTFILTLPQIFGFYIRGKKMFVMYWHDISQPASPKTMERVDFPLPLQINEWHLLKIDLRTAKENEWDLRIRLRTKTDALLDWESGNKPIRGVTKIHTLAFGDERPNDNDGGVFYWEGIKIYGTNFAFD